MTLHTLSHNVQLAAASGNDASMTSINKFGRNVNVADGVQEEIWDGSIAYTFPTDATEITHIRAAVDSATTQGAVIEVQGLDVNWAAVTQTKALDVTNSTTEVELDTALRRVFRMRVLDADVMDQNIWVGDDDFVVAAAKAIIIAGNNQTLMAMYTVPANKVAYMTSYSAAIVAGVGNPTSCVIKLWARDNANGYAPQIKHTISVDLDFDATAHESFNPYYRFGEKTDIYITATPAGASADVTAGFDLIIVDA